MITSVTLTPALSGASAVTLHGSSTRKLSRIQGLVGPPAPRDITSIRPGMDGIVDRTRSVGERIITIEGEVWGATGGAAAADFSTVNEALYSTMLSSGKLTVTYDNGDVRFCNVKLSSSVDMSLEGQSRVVSYQTQLRAADPRMYANTLKTITLTAPSSLTWTATSATATNAGTAPSPMTVVVTAGSNALSVSEIAVTVPTTYGSLVSQTYSSSLFSNPSLSIVSQNANGTGINDIQVSGGTSVSFYAATRTATSLSGVAAASEFPVLYPGTNSTVGIRAAASNVTGARCVFSWYDAFW